MSGLLKTERQRRIADVVAERGQATVGELAESFGVSEMTIRRDLHELDAHRTIRRTHGGAVATTPVGEIAERPLLERIAEQAGEKRRIARAVAAMLHSGETVFIGSGTTTLAVAEELVDGPPLTVVTNALTVTNTLASSRQVELVVTGGILRHDELSFIGSLAQASLDDIRVDRIVVGMRGVHPEHGLTSDHLPELATDQTILGIGRQVVVVADHTKLGRAAAARTAPVTAATVLVTSALAPPDVVEAIRRLGVDVIQV